MKGGGFLNLIIVLVILVAVWYYFGGQIKEKLGYASMDQLKVFSGEMNLDNPDQSIVYKKKEYKLNGTEGTFQSDSKQYPILLLYGESGGSVAIAMPKKPYRPNCLQQLDPLEGEKIPYKFYAEDENWCLYKN